MHIDEAAKALLDAIKSLPEADRDAMVRHMLRLTRGTRTHAVAVALDDYAFAVDRRTQL